MTGAAVFAWRKRKTYPLFFFGIGWYFICLIPTSNIFSAAFDITFYMAEHWIYFAAIGLFLIAAQALSRIFAQPKSKDIGLGLMLAVGAFLCARTIDKNLYWNNPIQFYHRTIALNPQAPRMMYNLGNEYRAISRFEDAVIWYKKALELTPQDTDIMNNLAGVYGDMGKFPEAIEVLTGIIGLRPDSIAAHYNLGNIYRNSEDTQKALEEYTKVTKLNPAYADAYNDMAIIYLNSHKSDLAIAYFKKAISANPYYAPAYLNLALHYAQNGNIVEARTYYSTARKLGMSNPHLEQILK
jgi:tetratricopeptide (TPR) repeat protein